MLSTDDNVNSDARNKTLSRASVTTVIQWLVEWIWLFGQVIMTHTDPFSVGHLHFLAGLSQLSSLPICNTLFKTH